jgi:hypothetical protein
MAAVGGIAAKHLAGDLVEFAAQTFKHVSPAIHDRLKQGGEQAVNTPTIVARDGSWWICSAAWSRTGSTMPGAS